MFVFPAVFPKSDLLVDYNPPMDGSCQFSSIAHALQRNLNEVVSPSDLRHKAVDFLNNSPHYLDGLPVDFASRLTQQDGGDVTTYLDNMRKCSTFGDEITLTAIACLYTVQFVVVSSLGPAAIRLISPYADNQHRINIPTLLVGHYAETQEAHYVTLQNVENVRQLLDHRYLKGTTATNVHSEVTAPPLTEVINVPQQIEQIRENEQNDIEMSDKNVAAEVHAEIDDLGGKSAGPAQPRLACFPKTDFGKQNRAFSAACYDMFPWVEYSIKLDSAFCFPCRHFHVEGGYTEDLLIKKGFRHWKKLTDKLSKHAKSKSHITNAQKWATFMNTAAVGSVATKLSESYRAGVQQNRKNLAIICEIVQLLAKQGLPFRGHDESKTSQNKGNFLEICGLMAKHVDSFKCMHQSYFNCTSPEVQNELIEICASEVRKQIVDKIQESGFFTLMADEARASKTEQLSICVRYADNLDVKERFISFVDCSSHADAAGLYELLTSEVKSLGLHNAAIVAQSYDGAAVMAGHVSGVQQKIKLDHPCAVYIHCLAHKLNLVLVNSCSINRTAVGFFNTVEELYKYFSRPGAHSVFIQMQKTLGIKLREIVQQSDTRWACRWKSVNAVKIQYSAILHALEKLADPSEPHSVHAAGIGKHMQSIQFVLCLLLFEEILLSIHVVHKALQGSEMTLSSASTLIDKLKVNFSKRRNREAWTGMYAKAKAFCAENNLSVHVTVESTPTSPTAAHEVRETQPSAKRTVRTSLSMKDFVVASTLGQRNDLTAATSSGSSTRDVANSEMDSRKQNQADVWYLQLYLPVIDAIIGQLNMRFTDDVFALAKAVEAVFTCDAKGVEPLVKQYGALLNINAKVLEGEMALFNITGQPISTEVLRRELNRQCYPQYYRLVQLALTLPVGTASAERSFSAMRRIRNWLRSTMSQDRLSSLAVLNIESDLTAKLKPDDIVSIFADAKTRFSFH